MLTWSNASVVSYYRPLLSSSKAGNSIEQTALQAFRLIFMPCGYLSMAPTLASHLFLPGIAIIANNYQGQGTEKL